MERKFEKYKIQLDEATIRIFLKGVRWFDLPFGSAINQMETDDVDSKSTIYTEEKTQSGLHAEWMVHSSCWSKKVYLLDANEDGIYYRVRVSGKGHIKNIEFFNQGTPEYETGGYLRPVGDHSDYSTNLRTMIQKEQIGLGYQTPPMYCFPFFMDDADLWFGFGVIAKAGEYNFDRFIHNGMLQLELPLYGQTYVDGEWESQGIWGGAGTSAFDVLRAYSAWHYNEGLCKKGITADAAPKWWKGPIFCGWGSQAGLMEQSRQAHGRAEYTNYVTPGALERKEYATQANYTLFSEILDREDLHPAFIIIDSRWQKKCGEAMPDENKWPDLRGFVDNEHRKGRRVLLWFKMWNNEGLDESECVMDLCRPVAADPTSPRYRDRVKKMMYRLLSDDADCYNCDGFKIDFANCMPLGETVESSGGKYGVELLKQLMLLIYENAKNVKADALINCSACHPYFAEVCDEARLHDYQDQTRLVCSTMRFRKQLFQAAMPNVLIDTDEGGMESHRDFIKYMSIQKELGIPDLYNLFPRGGTPMDEADFSLIRGVWKEYQEQL